MKNVLKLIGIIALMAVIGFSFAACDNDAGGGGGGSNPPVFTLTNINSTHQSEGSNWFVLVCFLQEQQTLLF